MENNMVAKSKEIGLDALEMEMRLGQLHCHIVGTSPMIMHRFSAKAQRELLMPSPKKNRAEKEASLKHDPIAEFRDSIYLNRDPSTPAAVHIPSNAFSAALANAALDVPGATKSQLMRLTTVADTHINLFGVPKLFMAMTRSSDMGRTPDVRTRAIFPRWACKVSINFVSSLLKEKQIANLLATAGLIIGIGDWRSQKGGSYGGFRIAGKDDPEYLEIVKSQGRKAQLSAIENPVCYDADSEELMAWFETEIMKRERSVPSSKVGVPVLVKSGNGKGLEA
jgi:hypothetical protein